MMAAAVIAVEKNGTATVEYSCNGNATQPLNSTTTLEDYGVFFAVAYGVLSFLIIVSNLMNIAVFSTSSSSNSSKHLYLSLACVDLILGLASSTFAYTAPQGVWPFSAQFCDILGFAICWSAVTSVNSLVLLSIERYVALTKPLQYKRIVTKRVCIIAVAIVWLLCAGVFFLIRMLHETTFHFEDYSLICVYDFINTTKEKPELEALLFFTSFGIPVPIIGFCYFHIFRVIVKAKHLSEDKTGKNRLRRRKTKGIRTLTLVLIMFFSCWTPYYIWNFYRFFADAPNGLAEFFVTYMAMCNSFINSIIYIVTNRQYSRQWRYLVSSLLGRPKSRLRHVSTISSEMGTLRDVEPSQKQ